MLEKQVVIDQIEVLESGVVQVRTATKIVDDGVEVSRTFHRHVVVPGQDYSAEEAKVQSICSVVHTPEAIAAYQAVLEAAQPTLEG